LDKCGMVWHEACVALAWLHVVMHVHDVT